MTNLSYPILVNPLSEEDGGGYVALVLDLVGCMADGDSPEEAIANVRGAIAEWCDEARRLGRDIPEPGSAKERAKQNRAALMKIMQEQSDLIEQQGQALAELGGEIAELKERVEAVAERVSNPEGLWDFAPELMAAVASDQGRERRRH